MKALWDATRAPHLDAARASPSDGVGVGLSDRVADKCKRASGQRLSAEQAKLHGNVVRVSEERELVALEKFKVSDPVAGGAPL